MMIELRVVAIHECVRQLVCVDAPTAILVHCLFACVQALRIVDMVVEMGIAYISQTNPLDTQLGQSGHKFGQK